MTGSTSIAFPQFRAFGAERQAFFEARIRAQQKAFREKQAVRHPSLAAKAGIFGKDFGAKLQNRRLAVSSGSNIIVDQRLAEDLQDLIARGAPAMAQAVDTHMGRMAAEVAAGWPVRTGLSGSMLDLEVEPISATRIRCTFASRYEKTMQAPRLRTALNQLVKPRVQPMILAIGADMLADLSRGG